MSSLTSQFVNVQSKLHAARLAAQAFATKLVANEGTSAKSVAAAIVLHTASDTALTALNTAIAAITYPTVTVSSVVYQCVKATIDFEDSIYTAEDVAADAALAANMIAAGNGMCSRGLIANFTATNRTGAAPKTSQFTDTSTGTATSWAWTFGDGGTSALQNPSHVYAGAGTYNVTLTITNAYGSDPETKSGFVVLS